MSRDERPYGTADASYQAAGGYDGIRELVDEFYRVMDSLPGARRIRGMHPADLEMTRDKLTRFLSGWLGGPKLFREKYGPISIPGVHEHLPIGEADRDAWLECMRAAIAAQPFEQDFADYLIEQLGIPAERVRETCDRRRLEIQQKTSR
jgi:hemoglobin